LIITLANVDQFSKFFHQLIRDKIVYTQGLPSHLQYVATLPCEIRCVHTYRIFSQINWWKNFENRSTFASYYQTSSGFLFLKQCSIYW